MCFQGRDLIVCSLAVFATASITTAQSFSQQPPQQGQPPQTQQPREQQLQPRPEGLPAQRPAGQTEAEQPEQSVVATVNGEAITGVELATHMKPQLAGREVEPAVEKQLEEQVLNSLIDGRLVEQYLREQGPEVAPGEINAALQRLEQGLEAQGASLEQFLADRGQTVESIRSRIAGSVAWEKLKSQQLTEERLQQHYATNREQFGGLEFAQARAEVVRSLTTDLWVGIVQSMRPQAEIRKRQADGAASPRPDAQSERQQSSNPFGEAPRR